MFKATGDSFYFEIVCPNGDIYSFVFERDYFWKKRTIMHLHLPLTFRTAKNLCPNM